MRRLLSFICPPVAAALALGAAATPAGAAGWVTAAPVSAAGDIAVTPAVALTPAGERLVAWVRLAPGSSDELGLAVRVAPPGGDFGPVQLLADPDAEGVSLTTGSDGTAALVWGSDENLHIATRAPGQGSFIEATPFPLGGFESGSPKVVMQGGDVYVTVASDSDTSGVTTTAIHVLRLAAGGTAITRIPGSGPGGTVAQVSIPDSQPRERLTEPTIALHAGEVHVAWEDELDSGNSTATSTTRIQRALGPLGGPLGAPIPVDTTSVTSSFAPEANPVIAAGGNEIDLAFTTATGAVAYEDVVRSSAIQSVTSDGFASNLHAAVDPAGTLVLAWQAFSAPDESQAVFSAIVPAGGPVGPVVRLTPLDGSRTLDDFVLGPDGSALALPDRDSTLSDDNADEQVQASFRAPGGGFGPLEEVSGPRDRTDPDADFDPAAGAVGAGGRAIVAWPANDGSGTPNERIFISERDATPPALTGVSVPAQASVQTSVGMSATAVDSQSATSVRWDFGDGSQAAGTVVSHAYGVAGAYLVTITAVDAFGNSASETRVITVTAPASTDQTPPVISGLRSSRSRFRAGTPTVAQIAAHRKRGGHPAATGTMISLRLSERATLVFSLSGKLPGHRSATPPPFIRAGRGPGLVTIPFSGRIGGARLAPGAYRLSVVAIDAAGNRSRTATVAFTVVSR
jgi:PKD domain